MQLTHHFEDLLKRAEKITSKYNQPAYLKKLPVAKKVFENLFHGDENIEDEVPTAWGN